MALSNTCFELSQLLWISGIWEREEANLIWFTWLVATVGYKQFSSRKLHHFSFESNTKLGQIAHVACFFRPMDEDTLRLPHRQCNQIPIRSML